MSNTGTVYIIRLKGIKLSQVSDVIFPKLFRMETGKTISYDALRRGRYGKPESIDGLFFNISHSKNYYVAMFCGVECGIDIEEPREISEKLKRRLLRRGERVLKGDALNNWVLKEAYSKYLGVGLNLDFREVSVDEITDEENAVDLSNVSEGSGESYVCYMVSHEKVDFDIIKMTVS